MLPAGLPTPQRPATPLKVRAFHGTEDARISLVDGERAVAQLRAAGIDAVMSAYPGVAHSVSSEMRRDVYATLEDMLTQ